MRFEYGLIGVMAFLIFSILAMILVNPLETRILIDFEDYPTPTPVGTPATSQLDNFYQDRYAVFNGPIVLDYTEPAAQPYEYSGFTSSGSNAIEQCYSEEFCSTPIVLQFSRLVKDVKANVGLSAPLDSADCQSKWGDPMFPDEPCRRIIMKGFGADGNVIGNTHFWNFEPSDSVTPAQPPTATLSILPGGSAFLVERVEFYVEDENPANAFNNNLAVDDLEFVIPGEFTE